MKSKTVDMERMVRSVESVRYAVDDEKRTVEMSFSSEEPVQRHFGREILDHSASAVDLTRLNSAAPLLVNHNWDYQVGVVEKARVGEDKRGRAIVRFGNSERAKEIFQDVRDGIRRLVSVGYNVSRMQQESSKDGVETYRVTSWSPMELSIVSVPADITVGIGRNAGETTKCEVIMDETKTITEVPNKDAATRAVNIEEIRADGAKAERQRLAEITAIEERWGKGDSDVQRICAQGRESGLSKEQVAMAVFQHKGKLVEATRNPNPMKDVPEKDLNRYSLMRAMNDLANHRPLSGLERELSDELTKRNGMQPRGFWVPDVVLTRDLTKGTATAGGNIVATDLLAGSFIDILRKKLLVARLGSTVLDGLVGNVVIPRQTGSVTAYWVTETQTSTESNMTFDQITMTPRCVTAIQDYSKELMIQSTPSIEGLVRNDIVATIAREIDRVAFHGSGSGGQPTGIAATSGIGSVAGGTNAAVPTWANVIGLETEVATDNADTGALAYATNVKVRAKLKQVFTNTTYGEIPIWSGLGNQDVDGTLNGYRAAVSNQIADNLTKGTSTTICSAIFFGNWTDLLLGFWGGGLDIMVDPYTQAATRTIRVLASQYTDVNVRHPESFAAMLDALTT